MKQKSEFREVLSLMVTIETKNFLISEAKAQKSNVADIVRKYLKEKMAESRENSVMENLND